MAFFAPYNPPVNSTFAAESNPSTATIIAELESSNFGNNTHQRSDRIYGVNIWVGGSTAATWWIEQATSTALTDTTDRLTVRTASQQHSQFLKVFKLAANDRIRVRHASTVTGTFEAYLQAQELA